MISVLGYELSRAMDLLQQAGCTVEAVEVSSRKGQPGNERRVIREQTLVSPAGDPPRICLTYAVFSTVVE